MQSLLIWIVAIAIAVGVWWQQGKTLTAAPSAENVQTTNIAGKRPIIVELFTSQGCSSCPPADKHLSELVKTRDDILPLSFHVDYWDYIGWKDPYSNKKHSDRQRQYGAAFKASSIYTPQMVIDGWLQASGSDRSGVKQAVQEAKNKGVDVPVALTKTQDDYTLSIKQQTLAHPVHIFFIQYSQTEKSKPTRGENRGRKLTHHNVVREYGYVGQWTGEEDYTKKLGKLEQGSVFLLQDSLSGRVVGMAHLGYGA